MLHFLFLPTLLMPLQTVYWTLQVEEFFYWLLPLLHRARQKIGAVPLLAVAWVVAAAWGASALLLPRACAQLWLENTPLFLPAFVLGIVTATRWRALGGMSGRRLVVLGTAFYVGTTPLALQLVRAVPALTPITEVLFAPAASAVVLGVARGGAEVLARPVLRFLGGISFSLYLWHMVVIRVLPLPDVIATSFVLRALVTTAVSIPVALVSYLCVERPFLQLRPHQAPPAQAA